MQLKDYQAKLLDDYADFLRRCVETGSAKTAYQESVRAWRDLTCDPPYHPLPGAEEVPYICLRVRNVEKQPGAFWRQTSRGRFYPDFIVKLTSGKVVVIEYKGKHLSENTSEVEKDDIGQLWERRSSNTCRFSMVKDKNWKELQSKLTA